LWLPAIHVGILDLMSDATLILSQIEQGDSAAAKQLLPLVYQELRRLAEAKMKSEKPGHTLQATALVHEVYLRLVDVERAQHWKSRSHFFAAAAEAMRRILIENARRKKAAKRGGNLQQQPFSEDLARFESDGNLLELNEAVDRFAEKDPVKAELVKLRYFAGLKMSDAANLLGISAATADRYWAYARAWLHQELGGTADDFDESIQKTKNP
jgi:RNA polymerase sigma factor (TIGR02999 family)